MLHCVDALAGLDRLVEPKPAALPAVARVGAVAPAQKPQPACPPWLWNLLLDGLSKLLAVRLEGAPPEDAVEGTARAWAEAVCHGQALDEALDAARLREAFTVLLRDMDRWPAPKHYLDRVAKRAEPEREAPLSDAQREDGQRGVAMLREVLAFRDYLEQHQRRQSLTGYLLADLRAAMRDPYERHRLYWDGRFGSRARRGLPV